MKSVLCTINTSTTEKSIIHTIMYEIYIMLCKRNIKHILCLRLVQGGLQAPNGRHGLVSKKKIILLLF